MRIGLMLGSFDPPHIGHAYAAIQALETGKIDQVWLVPAWHNPWKIDSSAFAFRSLWTKLMVRDMNNSRIRVNCVEGDLQPQYTYQLISHLIEQKPKHTFFIIGGTDVVEDIKKWKNSEYILEHCEVIGVDRSIINISSTKLREMLKNGKSTYPFLTKEVETNLKLYNPFKNYDV